MTAAATIDQDQERLGQFMGQFVGDLGAAFHASTVIIGDKLGLYRALANSAPLTSQELAAKTGTSERYIREWLAAQAASGYVDYDAVADRYSMSPEQAFALADEDSPAYIPGAFRIAAALFKDEPRLTEAFRSGRGVAWHEHSSDLFEGVEKFFRPNYIGNLVGSWLPSLAGVETRLQSGARVADVGCGHGASTIVMARAYPNSTFVGYDYHQPSIERARVAAAEAGLERRIQFEVASAKEYPGRNFDLVCFFDCLHDMGDPAGAAAHVRQSLAPDGTWMIVEPYANEKLADNLNPVGRIYYSASTMICTPSSLAQEVGLALGSQASEAALREIVQGAGFRGFRRASETPFNRVFEAKP